MMHELHAEDRQAIGEILSLHGHLFDGGHLSRLGEIFTPDVVYDMSAVGVGTFEGMETIRSAALRLGPGNPIAHHVTNVVITGEDDGTVTALSKGPQRTPLGGARLAGAADR
jgi:SnoaL-like domain